ncbi:MAG: ABC transporter permease [Planctomycetota bacterium]
MSLLAMVRRAMAQRPLATVLTALGVALGVALTSVVLTLQHELDRSYRRQSAGFSLVVGPSGSGIELVLNSIYHVGESRGLIPYSVLRELESEAWRPYLKHAVPCAVGDSYRGYRVVATTPAVFDPLFPQPEGANKFAAGGPFTLDPVELERVVAAVRRGEDPGEEGERREAVLGAEVARRLGLGVGSEIEPSHGVEGDHHHAGEDRWRVTGVLRATGTPIDRVVLINLDSFYRIAEHAGGRMPVTGEPGLSSILLFPRRGPGKLVLLSNLRKRGDLQVADVPTEIARLLDLVGNVDGIFLLVAVLVVVVAIVSVMVAIYNTMNERRREIAILRALGASRRRILSLVVLEAALVAAIGGLAGLILAHAGLAAGSARLAAVAGLEVRAATVLPVEAALLGAVVLAAAAAGMIPAWKAYRTDVARHLAPLS